MNVIEMRYREIESHNDDDGDQIYTVKHFVLDADRHDEEYQSRATVAATN